MSIKDDIENRKAALYIRVSTHMQIDKDSLPLQRNDLINYCKYALDIDRYEIFEDPGYSAKNTNRPKYQEMMTRLRTGEFSHLVVWKIDRISRNLLDFTQMYNELKRLGVVFVSKNEQFDTSTAMGEAMLKIILVFAELERNMTSERVTAVMISRAHNGQWNGGRVPLGYSWDKENKTINIVDDEALVVRKLYSKYEETHSLLQTAKYLNENSYHTRSGVAWNPTTVHIILKNPFYVGNYIYNKHNVGHNDGKVSTKAIKSKENWIIVENHHPAIIDAERQRLIIESMGKRNRNASVHTYTRVNTHIFAGLLFCGNCNLQMQSTIDRVHANGYRPSIYQCTRRRRFNDCNNKYISDVVVGPFVLNYISNVIKAQNNFGKSTSIETFERKLLRGSYFTRVDHIEEAGLREMYDMLKSGKVQDVRYAPPTNEIDETIINERDLLASEKRKKERALARLKTLYLYDDSSMSESDYIYERKLLTDRLEQIDTRLEEIEKQSSKHFSISDEDFLAKASYFIMSQELLTERYVNFNTLVRKTDTKIIKNFLNSIIQKIVILDGKIISIRFKNGIEHKFSYK